VNASIVEADLRSGDEVADGLRDEHLARSGMRRDPGADVDGEPGDLALVELALADVDSDPRFEAERSDAVDDRLRRPDRACRAVEGREEPVAGGVALVAAEPGELPADDRVVAGEQVAPGAVADPYGMVGRADDVREDDRRQPATSARGAGLQNMADRVEALVARSRSSLLRARERRSRRPFHWSRPPKRNRRSLRRPERASARSAAQRSGQTTRPPDWSRSHSNGRRPP
jgi:hypothetical protein